MDYRIKLHPTPYLAHHGIKGQKWGVRRFQNPDGSLTPAGRERYGSGGRDRAEATVARIGNRTASELTGSIDPSVAKSIIASVATVSVAVIGEVALTKVANKALVKQRLGELENLKNSREIESFEKCPKIKERTSAEKSMRVTNPDYPDEGTTMNCTFCTTAMALREKGYDVVAKKTMAGMPSEEYFQKTFNSPTVKMRKARSGKDMLDELKKNGDGAYGNLSVEWKGGGRHSIFWKNEKGQTRIYDGQSGEEYTSSSANFENFSKYVNCKKTLYNRLDNCEPTDYALGVVERRK